jgi:hypothetical protein
MSRSDDSAMIKIFESENPTRRNTVRKFSFSIEINERNKNSISE